MKAFFRENYLLILSMLLVIVLFLNYNRRMKIRRSYSPLVIEGMEGGDLVEENANLKLLAKYLTLIIRKNEAQKELYTIETGKRQVYNSPTLVQLNRQLTVFKEKIRSNPSALKYFDENLGSETKPTLFQWRKQTKPFHNDYCFASKDFMNRLKEVSVGEYADWKEFSDHMPVIVTFDDG